LVKIKPDIVREIDAKTPTIFTQLDRQFADLMQKLSGTCNPELVLAARLVSNQIGKGSVCVHIPSVAGRDIYDVLNEDDKINALLLYNENQWLTRLKDSDVTGKPGDVKPLIIDDKGRLYLYRYWLYEQKLAENIKTRLASAYQIDMDVLKQSAGRLFKSDDDIEQRIAAIAACLSGFCVISGGPGTGKTSLVIKILTLLLENATGVKLKIALAAPTGKAAARLSEAIKSVRGRIDCSDKIKESIPDESFTIHRLLGNVQGSPYFRYNANNQLPFDIIVVDESSMADLALTAKLFEAVPVKSRLILLGDKDQLSSVEAGAVLGDICDTGSKHAFSYKLIRNVKQILSRDIPDNIADKKTEPSIADSIMTLSKSYRFAHGSGIGEFSRAIKDGEADKALNILKNGNFTDINLIEYNSNKSLSKVMDSLSQKIIAGYSPYIKAKSPEDALSLLSNFTILCALRKGIFGVERINIFVEEALSKKRLINFDSRWYENRTVMITRNDYNSKLYNGDSGIMLRDPKDGIVRFFTSASDGSIRKILPLKLPEHETAYAMTVHKSQGSEFDNALLLLPDRVSPVLSRELLYTAITRARKKIEIYSSENILRYMINNPTTRVSGLRDALWNT
jgi:exodeoxyribonuclease V alpha subunit